MVNYLAIIGAYLLGSLSFAVIVSRCMGMPDPHSYGSGNPGATNVLRTGKKSAAALTLLGDALKGWLAVWLAKHYQTVWQLDSNTIAIIAVVVLIGHMWPVFFKFKGGKGVASLAALIATLISPFAAWWFMPQLSWVIAVIVIDILVLYRHKSNIKNLFSGREGKIGETK